MKSKQLFVLAVLVVVLGIASILLLRSEHSSWQAPSAAGTRVLAEFDPNAVARVEIKNKDGSVVLTRREDKWTVEQSSGYPANFERISGLIRRLWDLKSVQEVAAGPSQFAQLELVEPAEGKSDTGTVISLEDASGKRLTALLAGKTHMQAPPGFPGDGYAAGRYLMALDGKNRVVLVSDLFDETRQPAKDWLERDFLRIANPKSITLKGPNREWSLTRENPSEPWKLANGVVPEAGKAGSIVAALGVPSFDDVSADESAFDFSEPDTLTVQTTDGFTYTWTIGKQKDDTYPVKIAINGDFPKERTPAEDEKPEDKEKLDEAFAKEREALEKRLAEEKRFEKWIYRIPATTLSSILVSEKDLQPPTPTQDQTSEKTPEQAPDPTPDTP